MFRRKEKPVSDEQLMQQISAGNQQAFNLLYQRYNRRLYYFFYRMLGNSEEYANDFLQDIFMKIVENPGLFNPKFSFSRWLFSVAHNMCKNEYRKRENQKTTAQETDHIIDETQPKSDISTQAVIERVYDYLNHQGEEHRTVFILHYREGFAIKEIAEMMELPLGTVKSRLFYTRKLLATKFEHLKNDIEF